MLQSGDLCASGGANPPSAISSYPGEIETTRRMTRLRFSAHSRTEEPRTAPRGRPVHATARHPPSHAPPGARVADRRMELLPRSPTQSTLLLHSPTNCPHSVNVSGVEGYCETNYVSYFAQPMYSARSQPHSRAGEAYSLSYRFLSVQMRPVGRCVYVSQAK